VEVNGSNKHSRLLKYGIIYDCKMFYDTGSWSKKLTTVIGILTASNVYLKKERKRGGKGLLKMG
jgi:hypothetical protein